VINDILDTDQDYILGLKERGMTVINFEDLGPGAQIADLVINALYPEAEVLPNHHFGEGYFCARDEFIYSPTKTIEQAVSRVLISFGGVDPNNLTRKTLDAIYADCRRRGIVISVILGLGYHQQESLAGFEGVEIRQDVHNISEEMLAADIAFTSAGRTIYELACIGTPTIVMAQNDREMTHLFALSSNGLANLGLGVDRNSDDIRDVFCRLLECHAGRKQMNEAMLSRQVRAGRQRVLRLIQQVIEDGI